MGDVRRISWFEKTVTDGIRAGRFKVNPEIQDICGHFAMRITGTDYWVQAHEEHGLIVVQEFKWSDLQKTTSSTSRHL